MVKLTVTAAAKVAIELYCESAVEASSDDITATRKEDLADLDIGSPIEHDDLIEISGFLVSKSKSKQGDVGRWRLETLLKGANVYQPPPIPKPEPTSEYKALMRRLRADEERQQYERMINPLPPNETFHKRFPGANQSFASTYDGSFGATDDVDEATYADVNRQMTLIINVLVSVVCCSVAIWIAARRWDVPQRLGLSMSGSGLVAAAEVAIYMGYIRRVQEAKGVEIKKVEKKEIVDTWVLDGSSKDASTSEASDGTIRHRKGKHR